MEILWEPLIKPVLAAVNPSVILEIGAEFGGTTKLLLEHCIDKRAQLHSIDPVPHFDVAGLTSEHPKTFHFHQGLSLNVLPKIKDYQLVLIDGDHNWYTVINELRLIDAACQGKPFPVVICHDVGWPYGRRDMYYDPETIPPAFRKPYKKAGIVPGREELQPVGGLNYNLDNSIYENNVQNGVLTALEDFTKESKRKLHLTVVPTIFGVALLYEPAAMADNQSFVTLLEQLGQSGIWRDLLVATAQTHYTVVVEGADLHRQLEAERKTGMALRAEVQAERQRQQQLLEQMAAADERQRQVQLELDQARQERQQLRAREQELLAEREQQRRMNEERLAALQREWAQLEHELRAELDQARRALEEQRQETRQATRAAQEGQAHVQALEELQHKAQDVIQKLQLDLDATARTIKERDRVLEAVSSSRGYRLIKLLNRSLGRAQEL